MSCPTLPFSLKENRSAKGLCHSRIEPTQKQMYFTVGLFMCSTAAKLHIYLGNNIVDVYKCYHAKAQSFAKPLLPSATRVIFSCAIILDRRTKEHIAPQPLRLCMKKICPYVLLSKQNSMCNNILDRRTKEYIAPQPLRLCMKKICPYVLLSKQNSVCEKLNYL